MTCYDRSTVLCATIIILQFSGLESSAEERSIALIEQAFRNYVVSAQLVTQTDAVLISQIPCDDALCLQFAMPLVSRDHAFVNCHQLASGFGFGVDVHSVRLASVPQNISAVSITVVAAPRRLTESRPLASRAARWLALLKSVVSLSSQAPPITSIRQAADDAPVYYIQGIYSTDFGTEITVTVFSPPHAPALPALSAVTEKNCSCVPEVAPAVPPTQGLFKGWQVHMLKCRWVCKEPDNRLD